MALIVHTYFYSIKMNNEIKSHMMVSQSHNILIKFLKSFGRGPAQPIKSLQVVKRSKSFQAALWF